MGVVLAIVRAWQVYRLLVNADVFTNVLEKLLRQPNLQRARKLCSAIPDTPLGAATAALLAERTLPKGAKEAEISDILRAAFVEGFSSKAATITTFRFLSLASFGASVGAIGLAASQGALSLKTIIASSIGIVVLAWSAWSAYKLLGSGPIVLERLLPKVVAQLTGTAPTYREPEILPAEKPAEKTHLPPDLGSIVIDVHNGTTSEGTLTFEQPIIKIGRVETAHVCLKSARVARMHAVIERDDSGVSIIDLGSANGTIVNGEKVNKARLSHGDVVEIGPYRLTMGIGGRPHVDEPNQPERVLETDDPKTWGELDALFYGFETRSPDVFYEIVTAIVSKPGNVRIAKLQRNDAPRFVVAVLGRDGVLAEARSRIEREAKQHYGRFATPIGEIAPDALYGAETSTHAKISAELAAGEVRLLTTTRV